MLTGDIVFSDEFHFQLCPEDHRRRVWRHPWQHVDPAFTIACHQVLKQELRSGVPFYLTVKPLWSSLEAHLQHSGNYVDLVRRWEQIYHEIPQETIRVIYDSIPCHVVVCIQARGGSIPFCARYFVSMYSEINHSMFLKF
ncbi:transposable element Tc1 transposase [Trichonephila clavipes]|uniref:Transposable element Tc1 transposase n=1 Tax=Trichonephila clavipes TaxID=2585209 RepID=A0A8X6V7C4_TRICX|nr:transposable element Tc1 transposase [Trichonephila clavipes]